MTEQYENTITEGNKFIRAMLLEYRNVRITTMHFILTRCSVKIILK